MSSWKLLSTGFASGPKGRNLHSCKPASQDKGRKEERGVPGKVLKRDLEANLWSYRWFFYHKALKVNSEIFERWVIYWISCLLKELKLCTNCRNLGPANHCRSCRRGLRSPCCRLLQHGRLNCMLELLREEDDMTLSPFFPKSSKVVQKCPKVS